MKVKLTPGNSLGGLAILCFALALSAAAAQAKDFKFEGLLIWATNAEKSPDPNHKPADAGVLKKLKELPLKWKNYFVVTNVTFLVPERGSAEITLSEKCQIKVKHVDRDEFEVSLIGKGEPVLKRTQPLPRADMLVLGGNAPDSNGWLVLLKRLE